MKNTLKYITYATLLSFTIVSCSSDFDQPVEDTPDAITSSGVADFSNFVALGDSLTAGLADGTLYIDGQEYSFANMLATQMQAAGGSDFTIPLMDDNYGGFVDQENFPVRLIFDAVNLAPVSINAESTTIITDVTPGPYNNTGIPGAKSFHLAFNGYGNLAAGGNPYFARMASTPSASPLDDVMEQNPTFFSLWVGANDVLGYAMDGGDPDEGDSITDLPTFEASYNFLVSSLTSEGALGLLTNIPNVASLPFFTTVPHNPVPLDAETAAALNSDQAYGAYNAGILQVQAAINAGLIPNVPAGFLSDEEIAKRTISFTESETNAVVILDESLTDLSAFNPALTNMRQATAADLLVLTSRSFIGSLAVEGDASTVNGIAVPLADKWVLTPEEQEEIITATNNFNEVIVNAAEDNRLAFYDAAARVDELANGGVSINGSLVTNEYVSGGFFSLDGIHLSPKGNGITANEMIDVINTKYNATLDVVETRDLPTVFIK